MLMKKNLIFILLGLLMIPAKYVNAQLVITEFTDDYEDGVIWEGWDLTSATHTLTEADGMLTIAVDKPTEAEKWDGLIMGFGENTLIDLTANGWLSVDLKSDGDCLADISVFDINGEYNPGNNQLQLTGGADWVSMKFEHAGDNLIHYQWDGVVLGTVDASVIDHLLMTFNGGSAWTGTVYMDNMVLGITPVTPSAADITFIVDDSEGQTHTAFAIKGSWDTETGAYDTGWTDGAEHSPFYDDGTHGDDVAGDHIWTVTLSLISDGGTNDWEWGVNDSDGSWIDGNFGFTVADGTAQTLDPYVIEGSVSVESAIKALNTVHPNPASSTIYIHSNEIISSIELYDMNGQLTLNQIDCGSASMTISVENQHSGIYLLKTVTNNGNVIYQKLIVE